MNEDVLKQMPAPDREMRDAGLPGRVFPAVGNHEVWDDSDVEGLLTAFPYLKKFGVSDKTTHLQVRLPGCSLHLPVDRQIRLSRSVGLDATRPVYEEQMKQLQAWLDEAKATGTKKVFISFHAPAFAAPAWAPFPKSRIPTRHCRVRQGSGHRGLQRARAHHEVYEVDGVKYLVLGGGGAEQDPILPGRTHIKVPNGYPLDQYWKGGNPKEEYNYILVDVKPGKPTTFTLNRFRPGTAEPFATVELFK